MPGGGTGLAGSTAESANAMPSAGYWEVLPHWWAVNDTSNPVEVGTLVAAKSAPTESLRTGVRDSAPEPFGLVTVPIPASQVRSTPDVVLPSEVRQARFVRVPAAGLKTAPVPSAVLVAKVCWNSTVPAAEAVPPPATTVSEITRAAVTTTDSILRARWIMGPRSSKEHPHATRTRRQEMTQRS